jgi:hypothetical protein
VAETLDWAQALSVLGVENLDVASAASTLGTLLKYREDHSRVLSHGLEMILKAAQPPASTS